MKIVIILLCVFIAKAQIPSQITSFGKSIEGAAISDDMQNIAIVSKDHIIVVNSQTKKLVNQLTGIASPVSSILFHYNNRMVIAGTKAGSIHIWNIESGQMISTLKPHRDEITDIIIPRKEPWLITSSLDGHIVVNNIHTKELVFDYSDHQTGVTDMDYHEKSKLLVSSSSGGELFVRNLEKSKLTHQITKDNMSFQTTFFNENQKSFFSITSDGKIQEWSTETTKAKDVFKTNTSSSSSIISTSVKDIVAIAYSDQGKIDFVSTKKWKKTHSIEFKGTLVYAKRTPDNLFFMLVFSDRIDFESIDFLFTDDEKIEHYINTRVQAFAVPQEDENKNEYKKRTATKKMKKLAEDWYDEAIDHFGNQKYKVLKSETLQMEMDEITGVVRVFGPDLETIYLKLDPDNYDKFRKNFNSIRIEKPKFVYANNTIVLKSAKFKIKKFNKAFDYDITEKLTFKGQQTAKELQIMKPKFKF